MGSWLRRVYTRRAQGVRRGDRNASCTCPGLTPHMTLTHGRAHTHLLILDDADGVPRLRRPAARRVSGASPVPAKRLLWRLQRVACFNKPFRPSVYSQPPLEWATGRALSTSLLSRRTRSLQSPLRSTQQASCLSSQQPRPFSTKQIAASASPASPASGGSLAPPNPATHRASIGDSPSINQASSALRLGRQRSVSAVRFSDDLATDGETQGMGGRGRGQERGA